METVLSINNISKSFSGVKVLQNINLHIQKGEVHVIVGENGAGKSTLMKIISGVYTKDEGEIRFEGKPVEISSAAEAQKLGISIIHQEFNLLPYRTVAQNIFLGREPVKRLGLNVVDEKQINEKSRELMAFLGVDIDPDTMVGSLGIAQQQMVEVAKALSFKSKVLIMDEPTATLTSREIEKLFAMIDKLRSENVSIIYISHRLEELKRIADTITVLRDGKTVHTTKADEISIDEIIRLMVGREIKNQFHRDYNEPGEEVLRVEDFSSYRFKDAALHLRRGEIVGISGLVGAGRTDLAKAIFGYEGFEKGNLTLFGKRYKKLSTKQAVKLRIGFAPEDRKEEGVAVKMPIRHNTILASMGRLFRNGILNRKVETETVEQQVKNLNVSTTSINKPVNLLSGGNQQKVVIAKWLCAQCELIIFDEPTRGIDVGAKAEIYAIMNEFVRQGKAILMISSDLLELLGICDRIYVMKDGRITGEFDKDDATQEKILAKTV